MLERGRLLEQALKMQPKRCGVRLIGKKLIKKKWSESEGEITCVRVNHPESCCEKITVKQSGNSTYACCINTFSDGVLRIDFVSLASFNLLLLISHSEERSLQIYC